MSWTMEMRFWASRLNRRLLPTLGRPTMATVRDIAVRSKRQAPVASKKIRERRARRLHGEVAVAQEADFWSTGDPVHRGLLITYVGACLQALPCSSCAFIACKQAPTNSSHVRKPDRKTDQRPAPPPWHRL